MWVVNLCFNKYVGPPYVGPKCTLAASHTAPGKSRWVCRRDRRQTVTLCLSARRGKHLAEKRNVTVWRPSVCMSAASVNNKYVSGDWTLSTHADPTSTRRAIFHERRTSSVTRDVYVGASLRYYKIIECRSNDFSQPAG